MPRSQPPAKPVTKPATKPPSKPAAQPAAQPATKPAATPARGKPAKRASAAPVAAPPTRTRAPIRLNTREGRANKGMISGWFDRRVTVQFNVLSASRQMTNQNMLGEALDDLFAKYGLPLRVSGYTLSELAAE